MINRIVLNNFKCFEKLDLELSSLNVLAGINSMGKSTSIQALLLIRQSFEMGSLKRGIYLNGEYTNIGTGYDLMYRNSQSDIVSINLQFDDIDIFNVYKYEAESDYQSIINTSLKDNDVVSGENLFNSNFSYVSAERTGPQKYYASSYREIYEENQVGIRGEYFAGYLAERGIQDKVENKMLLHQNSNSQILIYQMEAWMSELSPGIHFDSKKYQEAGIVSLDYKIASENYTPVNVGFGLSYVAPIVLALLKAKQGDLIILENPEAHLHPRGQRKMGEMISLAAAGGAQVIVETHSDHLLNGIRLSVKSKKIEREKIRLNYFYEYMYQDPKLGEVLKHEKCSPMILEDGRLTDWPDGFFDEWDKALEELF